MQRTLKAWLASRNLRRGHESEGNKKKQSRYSSVVITCMPGSVDACKYALP